MKLVAVVTSLEGAVVTTNDGGSGYRGSTRGGFWSRTVRPRAESDAFLKLDRLKRGTVLLSWEKSVMLILFDGSREG
jgi:hypothetical protein